jgi:hypothetical protein
MVVPSTGRRALDVVEKSISVLRLSDHSPTLFWAAVDGFEPIVVKEHLLGHVLGLIFGGEAAARLKEVVEGAAGQLKASPWVNEVQVAALDVLLTGYGMLKG